MFKGLLLGASGFCTLVVGTDELVDGGLYLRVRDARLDHAVGEARGELILTVSERLSDFRRLLFHFEIRALFVSDYRFGRLNHLPSSTWRRVLEEDFNHFLDGFLSRLVFLLGFLCFGVLLQPLPNAMLYLQTGSRKFVSPMYGFSLLAKNLSTSNLVTTRIVRTRTSER